MRISAPLELTGVSVGISICALLATAYSAYTSHASLLLSQHMQQTSLFSEFQQEYATIASRFPPRLLEKDFRPEPGTGDYRRLEEYWIFSYAEWYATNRMEPSSYRPLWDGYYAPLALNALEIPSLRYTLERMSRSVGNNRKDMQRFYQDLRDLARNAGQPLSEVPAGAVEHSG